MQEDWQKKTRRFFETYGYPHWIDEFQRVPELFLEMKRIADKKALDDEDRK